MGRYYDIYAEVSFNGKWVNIDSRVLGIDGKIHHAPVIWGQSWLGEAIDELSDHSFFVNYDNLSDGTKSKLGGNDGVETKRLEAVDFQTAIKDRIKSSPARRGYVFRSSIACFQIGEIDSLDECISPYDYAKLDKAEQCEYSYYEWDDRDGWYAVFKEIASRVEYLVNNFNDFGIPYEVSKNLDETRVKEKDVRLVIVRG